MMKNMNDYERIRIALSMTCNRKLAEILEDILERKDELGINPDLESLTNKQYGYSLEDAIEEVAETTSTITPNYEEIEKTNSKFENLFDRIVNEISKNVASEEFLNKFYRRSAKFKSLEDAKKFVSLRYDDDEEYSKKEMTIRKFVFLRRFFFSQKAFNKIMSSFERKVKGLSKRLINSQATKASIFINTAYLIVSNEMVAYIMGNSVIPNRNPEIYGEPDDEDEETFLDQVKRENDEKLALKKINSDAVYDEDGEYVQRDIDINPYEDLGLSYYDEIIYDNKGRQVGVRRRPYIPNQNPQVVYPNIDITIENYGKRKMSTEAVERLMKYYKANGPTI